MSAVESDNTSPLPSPSTPLASLCRCFRRLASDPPPYFSSANSDTRATSCWWWGAPATSFELVQRIGAEFNCSQARLDEHPKTPSPTRADVTWGNYRRPSTVDPERPSILSLHRQRNHCNDALRTTVPSVNKKCGRWVRPTRCAQPACNDTRTAFCFPNEEDAELRRTDDVSLWPWSLALKLVRNVARVVEYPPADFVDSTNVQCFGSKFRLISLLTSGYVCSSGFYWLRQLRRVRRSIDKDSIKTLAHAFVMSRVDYCNAVFADHQDILLISAWASSSIIIINLLWTPAQRSLSEVYYILPMYFLLFFITALLFGPS